MIKNSLLIITLMIGLFATAQINFEKGYYINNQGDRIDCLIKNIDWKDNPNEIKFKINEADQPKTLKLKDMTEFGIDSKLKFERHTVKIDKSSDALSKLGYLKQPDLKTETLLLRVILEGKSTLYQYVESNLIRYFFFNENLSAVEPLIYKRYLSNNISNNQKILKNNEFKQQLYNNVRCPDTSIGELNNLSYSKSSLIKHFEKFNQCNNVTTKTYSKENNNGKINITIRPGINFSSLSTSSGYSPDVLGVNFGSQTNFRVGLELEYVMPFNKNKWSLFTEPTYQYFEAEGETSTGQSASIDYSSIEIPIGLRYSMFLNDDSKIFINGAFIFDLNKSSQLEYETSNNLEVKSAGSFALGIGYKYKKYSLEYRYYTSRNITDGYALFSTDYQTNAIIIGYSFL